MSREDVLEETPDIMGRRKNNRFSLRHSFFRVPPTHSPTRRQNTKVEQFPSSVKGTDPKHT